ncbi:hypothetical protein F5Y18DRAFT_322411 [Xylariaceae sp. FL1019]|nr:hypothetical protein F5Y18DRAFT_322411 [Xylariaceae sp. FL1019]
MLTMSRLPSDSFLPSGGIDLDHSMPSFSRLNGSSTSVISPLSLSHTPNQHSYFDAGSVPPNYIHSPTPLSGPGSRHYLSPDQTHRPSAHDPRSSSLSPNQQSNGSAITLPFMASTSDNGLTSPFGHLSPTSAANLLQRREEHNRKALESWKAERAHLEACRARAEEMFTEERTLMDEERTLWIEQKQKLEAEVADWRKRAEKAESNNSQLLAAISKMQGSTEDLSTTNRAVKEIIDKTFVAMQGFDGAMDKELKSMLASGPGSTGHSGPSTSKVLSPIAHRSPSGRPKRGSTMPESKPFEPLDPRMQSGSVQNAPPIQTQSPASVVDVHDIIPELDGIRLKAPAVRKPTFTDGKPRSPPLPADADTVLSPGDKIMKALRVPMQARLTLHAGHTPNHSISFSQLPTRDSTFAPNTADSSGTSTPTRPKEQAQTGDVNVTDSPTLPFAVPYVEQDPNTGDAAVYEPSDEAPALKGPLTLKNRPASDEVFLRRLSDKLEEVKAHDARPSVLADDEDEPSEEGPKKSGEQSTHPEASAATENEGVQDQDAGMETIEQEIPLKLKKSSNFGQPLGELGNKSGF